MAQFQLSRASASDIPEISAVLIRTYEVDPVIRHLFPNVPFDEQLKFYCEWLGEEVDRPWERFWKTIDVETGYAHVSCPSGRNAFHVSIGLGKTRSGIFFTDHLYFQALMILPDQLRSLVLQLLGPSRHPP